MEKIEMIQGKIYHISFGENTSILGRFKEEDVCNYSFYDLVHYWNGHETFRKETDRCCKSGITSMRPASKAEKHTLLRFEIEYDCI